MAAIGQSIRRSAIGLGLFAVITGGTIATTQVLTADRIAHQVREAEASALLDVIPRNLHDNDMLTDTLQLSPDPLLGNPKPVTAWLARKNGNPTGVILPVVAPDGYSGAIYLLVGIDPTGSVLGVRVTRHHETPGLGDKIEIRKTPWVHQFEGRSLDNPSAENWAVVKDGGAFDQFTGATITPRAVVKSVKQALVYFDQHARALLAPAPASDTGDHMDGD